MGYGTSLGTRRGRAILLLVAAGWAAAISLSGCATASNSAPSTPPETISVAIAPASTSLFLGQTQAFQATVTGSSNTAVTWQVNGVAGGNSAAGQISSAGVYSAPGVLPSPANVTITAVSAAANSATASAAVTLEDDIVVTVAPATSNVPAGGAQVFAASFTASGSPAAGFTWSVNGIAGGNATVGTIAPGGSSGSTAVYTAPATPPAPATVTIMAASVADRAKSGSASVNITCGASNAISPAAANVALGGTQPFLASFCLAAGATVAWDVNGVAGGNATLGTITTTGADTASYAAPADLPGANPLTIHAAASAVTSGSGTAAASVTLVSAVRVAIAPLTATVAPGTRISLSANVTGTTDGAVSWYVNGTANGDAADGQICVAGSNPCTAPAGPSAASVDFFAPASIPGANPVAILATSLADGSQSGTASLTIAITPPTVTVAVTPSYAFLVPSGLQPDTQQFTATVTGSTNTGVTWSVQSAVSGQGCTGAACGTIDTTGLYTAPLAAPSPNSIAIVASSTANPAESGTATVAVTSGPTIQTMLPSSAMAGAVNGFALVVRGVNFTAGSGSGASTILLNGTPRATTCATGGQCATALNPADVAAAGTVTVAVQNPGTPGAISNVVPLVVVPYDESAGTISLTAGSPAATSADIVVTESTTAASSSPIDVQFIGLLTGGNNCTAQGSPVTVTRPASGTASVSICVYGDGLDPAFLYAFSGPNGAQDIGVTASAISGLFPGTIELDLQVSSATLAGARTLFITTLNDDRAVATGMLEVK